MVLCGTDLAGVLAMTIHRLFVNSPLGPEEISIVVAAYEQALSTLGLVDRDDPLTQLIAKKTNSDLADRHQGLGDNMRTGDQSAWPHREVAISRGESI
jgi:hypothetical protein